MKTQPKPLVWSEARKLLMICRLPRVLQPHHKDSGVFSAVCTLWSQPRLYFIKKPWCPEWTILKSHHFWKLLVAKI